jgi:26S proteasome regulatory subunit N6
MALKAFKLLIVCKIMMNQMDDVNNLLNGKYSVKYAGTSLDAMREIAKAHG